MWYRRKSSPMRLLILTSAGILGLACSTQEPVANRAPETEAPPAAVKDQPALPTESPPVEPDPAPSAATGDHIERVCNVMELSGAARATEAEHQYLVAEWLGRNVTSAEGRAFLADLARTPPAGKSAFLRAASARAGLAECPLARVWDERP